MGFVVVASRLESRGVVDEEMPEKLLDTASQRQEASRHEIDTATTTVAAALGHERI